MSKKSIVVTVLLISIMVPLVNALEYREDVKIPITNGYGSKNLGTYKNPLPWGFGVTVYGGIVSPQNGNWRIKIWVDDTPVFDNWNVPARQEFSQRYDVKRGQKSNVMVEAWWSEKANITLNMYAKVPIL